MVPGMIRQTSFFGIVKFQYRLPIFLIAKTYLRQQFTMISKMKFTYSNVGMDWSK